MSFVDIHLHSYMSGKKILQTYKRKRTSYGLTQGMEKHGLPLNASEAAALSPTNKAQHQKPEHDEEEIYAEIITVNSEASPATVCLKGGSTCSEMNACPLKAPDVAVAQSPCSNLSNMEASESVGTVALNKASGLCRKMQEKLKQQPTPLITFIRRNKRMRDSLVSGSNQDLFLSQVSKLGIENQAAVFKLSVDNSKVGLFDSTPTDISAIGGIDIKEKPNHVSLQNSQASCSNTLKDCSLEDANNTRPANDPSIESLIVANESMQMPDHRRKVELPCLNLSIASLDQCGEMDGLDLNKEPVQTEPLSSRPSGSYLLQNEIPRASKDVTTMALQEAPKSKYLQLFPEAITARGSEEEESLGLGTNTLSVQPSSRYPFLPIDPNISENAYQTQEFMQHLYSSADQGSMLLRHKLIIDSILGRSTWSEEELDFLWVGVRRYGRNNWEAMLRDPRMHFSPWRSPRELAVRWEEEQIKLLSNICGSQTKSCKPPKRNHTRRASRRSNKMNMEEETLLSLGDLYVKPNMSDGLERRGRARSKRQSLVYKESYLRQDARLFQFHHPTKVVNTTSLPHWLQQVRDQTVSPLSSDYLDVGGEPCKQQSGVIIINSDSSSEETISDDNLS